MEERGQNRGKWSCQWQAVFPSHPTPATRLLQSGASVNAGGLARWCRRWGARAGGSNDCTWPQGETPGFATAWMLLEVPSGHIWEVFGGTGRQHAASPSPRRPLGGIRKALPVFSKKSNMLCRSLQKAFEAWEGGGLWEAWGSKYLMCPQVPEALAVPPFKSPFRRTPML